MALPINIIEIVTIVLWAKTGLWQPFALGMAVVAAIGVWLSVYYFRRVCYLCPDCHTVFRPRFREAFFARHTPWTEKGIFPALWACRPLCEPREENC